MAEAYGTKLTQHVQNSLKRLVSQVPVVQQVVTAIDTQGGKALLVGGAVRDLLLERETKDIDIEVHGLQPGQLESLLQTFGPVSLVGKMFGVFRLHGVDVDWSLPRSDSAGRKPDVTIDPHMDLCDAFARRDFTINAMGIDLSSYELIDCFGGQNDLQKRVLRSPDLQFFTQDPLRFFRVMQFVGRFELTVDLQLNNVCKTMDISEISCERIDEEFRKLLLKSKRPSRGIRWLRDVDRLKEVLPELHATIGVPQDPVVHPEGDVFEHAMQVLDAAARIEIHDEGERLILLYAALCHDVGKAETTEKIDGRWRALGHEHASETLAQKLLKRITRTTDLIDGVRILVKYHMVPMQFIDQDVKLSAYKRLAAKLAPFTIRMLAHLFLCDKQGRNPDGHEPLTDDHKEVRTFIERAQQAGVLDGKEEPILQGRDLLEHVQPGKQMGDLLRFAYRLQIEEGITDKQQLLECVLARVN